ncbi:MAG: hypothetical protein LH614_10340 [Pyrinomonadaceae bacterium]|nr:hypothetical protein [Pyrinomonadaceae bacterium]
MTPIQRVDEFIEEQTHHRYDVLDDQSALIIKHIRSDGLKAVPRITEITEEYDPTRSSGKRGHEGERFDAAWMLVSSLDNSVIRLRATEEGRRAIDALERSVVRMRAAGYEQKDQDDRKNHVRLEFAIRDLKDAKGINWRDTSIKHTFRIEYEIILSDAELLEFSNFLAANYPEYPSWSESKLIKDKTQINEAGNPLRLSILTKPERYYEVYSELKKQNENQSSRHSRQRG